MADFSKRSYQKELLDRDDIPFDDIKRNMQELDYINQKLGGHKITLAGFKTLLKNKKQVSVCEIGCGGGDNLRVIRNYCKKKNIPVKLVGVDINPNCIEFAKSRKENEHIEFVAADYKGYQQGTDIIFASLFCHHFTDEQFIEILKWMKKNCRIGFFINDLHRHPIAYYSIKWLTKLFSKSYLVKNDAPLSVLRGFKKKELQAYNLRAAIFNYRLKWKWAFRWLLIYEHK